MNIGDWIGPPWSTGSSSFWAWWCSSFRVVTSQNVIRAALFLVEPRPRPPVCSFCCRPNSWRGSGPRLHRGGDRALPLRRDDHPGSDWVATLPSTIPARPWLPSLLSASSGCSVGAPSRPSVPPMIEHGEPTSTERLASLLGRFVVPFEVVSFLLLAALIGGITIARKDLTPAEEESEGSGMRACA